MIYRSLDSLSSDSLKKISLHLENSISCCLIRIITSICNLNCEHKPMLNLMDEDEYEMISVSHFALSERLSVYCRCKKGPNSLWFSKFEKWAWTLAVRVTTLKPKPRPSHVPPVARRSIHKPSASRGVNRGWVRDEVCGRSLPLFFDLCK